MADTPRAAELPKKFVAIEKPCKAEARLDVAEPRQLRPRGEGVAPVVATQNAHPCARYVPKIRAFPHGELRDNSSLQSAKVTNWTPPRCVSRPTGRSSHRQPTRPPWLRQVSSRGPTAHVETTCVADASFVRNVGQQGLQATRRLCPSDRRCAIGIARVEIRAAWSFRPRPV